MQNEPSSIIVGTNSLGSSQKAVQWHKKQVPNQAIITSRGNIGLTYFIKAHISTDISVDPKHNLAH